ncbi:hypothetical protein AGABI1DRAFT_133987 [Agaricus bisporus var. burnettii JB137-S8]|uniref:Uncharacterized protein n=1 Tax=Agaricus bisporus var. burnettii (strain JB137-S8 / ATCC MYA-4627 / FGSC 10392) TaxID=597362 RepID=K5XHF0_AGABU|nr:uncharacterized protein AGABI1DRAFT_133987 [Agaricus bisporus var. burnettii JB137-S8]EKM73845.1 hypothetical protein AGABI1DRAFT_133987 [Agaricus bisporus var. burnettii JB137-S8]
MGAGAAAEFGYVEGAMKGNYPYLIKRSRPLREAAGDSRAGSKRFRRVMKEIIAENLSVETGCWLYVVGQHTTATTPFVHYVSPRFREDATKEAGSSGRARKEPASGGQWVLLASEGEEEWAREEPRIPPIKPAGYPQSEDARSMGESWAKVLPLPLPSAPAAANQGHVITGPGNSALGLGAGLISDNRLSIIDFLQSQFPVFSARSVPSLAPKMPRSGSKKARQSGPAPLPPPTLSEHIDQLLGAVDDDVETCACLAVSTSPEAQDAFCRRVRGIHIPPGFPQDALPANLFPQFMSWAGQIGSIVRPFSAPNIAAAKAYRTLQKNRQRWSKKDFIEAARLNPRAVDKTAFLKSIPRFAANLLQNPYPPKNAWIAESRTFA